MAKRQLMQRIEALAARLEAIHDELSRWEGTLRAGEAEKLHRLIPAALRRLEMVGCRNSLLNLPTRDLYAVCGKLLKHGATASDVLRSLPPRLRDRLPRSSFYRFRIDLLWSIDSLYRGLPAPAAIKEFALIGDRASNTRRRRERGSVADNTPRRLKISAGAPARKPA